MVKEFDDIVVSWIENGIVYYIHENGKRLIYPFSLKKIWKDISSLDKESKFLKTKSLIINCHHVYKIESYCECEETKNYKYKLTFRNRFSIGIPTSQKRLLVKKMNDLIMNDFK